MDKLDRKRFAAGANWAKMGDKCTAKFFQYHKDKKAKSAIKELLDGGRSITAQQDLESYIHRYYKDLYARDPVVEANQHARNECFLSVPRVVTDRQNNQLTSDISQFEVHQAVKDLPTHKAAGYDNIPTEWFQEAWDDIGPDITDLVKDTLTSGFLHPSLNLSLQSLIPKTGPQNLLDN